ncbi:MAG TPA: phage holin family protein [Longimicrobiales bacterium]|nr:phage holin family protein [Longimicrobiales bacterium]
MSFLLRLVATAAALWVAVYLVPGISHEGPLWHLLGVALLFGIVNAIVRPILLMLTCPLVLLTLGLFIFVLNALMLWLTSALATELGLAFHVDGFIPALVGSLIVSIVSIVLNVFIGDGETD